MAPSLPQIDELPRRNATQVKNQWRDLVREVRASGSVAVTNHDTVEMVVVDSTTSVPEVPTLSVSMMVSPLRFTTRA